MRRLVPARALAGVASVTGFALVVPLVAMRYTDAVDWDLVDFGAAAVMIFVAGMLLVVGVNRATTAMGKAVVATSVVAALAVGWAELAVGLFR